VLLSAALYLVYFTVLHEPGSIFYWFAAFVFIGCPLIAGFIAVTKTQKHKVRRFVGYGGAVFGVTLALFIVTYAVLPQFERANVQLPASCDGFDGVLDVPSQLAYTMPDGKEGVLLAQSAESVFATTIDGDSPPFASTGYLIRKGDGAVLQRMPFNNDVVMASVDGGTVYVYNDKLGYLLDERTGEFVHNILLIDNYGGLTGADKPIIGQGSSGSWYFETTAVLSNWRTDGSVRSRPHLTMNGIALGCYVAGATGEVIPLGPHG
jgi:hypothetical protein